MTAAVAASATRGALRQTADHPSRVQTWGRIWPRARMARGLTHRPARPPALFVFGSCSCSLSIDRSNVLTTSAGIFSVPPHALFRQWQRESQKDILALD